MRMRGIEPPRGCPHRHLKPARLPIPPHPRQTFYINDFNGSVKHFLRYFGQNNAQEREKDKPLLCFLVGRPLIMLRANRADRERLKVGCYVTASLFLAARRIRFLMASVSLASNHCRWKSSSWAICAIAISARRW
jgi:hypothetical protein